MGAVKNTKNAVLKKVLLKELNVITVNFDAPNNNHRSLKYKNLKKINERLIWLAGIRC